MTVLKRVETLLMLGQGQQLKVLVVQQETMQDGEYFMVLILQLRVVPIFLRQQL
jgi:hypothetical protein